MHSISFEPTILKLILLFYPDIYESLGNNYYKSITLLISHIKFHLYWTIYGCTNEFCTSLCFDQGYNLNIKTISEQPTYCHTILFKVIKNY